jgi:Phage head-tail joining protein
MPDNPSGLLPASTGIGALRWQVKLCQRLQTPSMTDTGLVEEFVTLAVVHADIQSTYPGTFYLGVQVDTPITHMIRLRWADYLEQANIITRTTTRPTDGTNRTEVYRVRRVKEIGGRKRFIEIEAELERVKTTAGDSDAEIESLFAEGGQPLPMRH